MGGEACPPELAARLVAPGPRGLEHLRPDRGHRRRVRRASSPARARCGSGSRSTAGTSPWSTPHGQPVPEGATGELIIGGVGLARYLDPAKDAEKYAAMPTLGWDRAYRSGDLVVNDPAGLLFGGPRRRPGQARRPADRARRDRLGPARPARRGRRRRGGTHGRRRQPAAGRLRRGRRRLRRRPGHGAAAALAARRAGAAARGRRRASRPGPRARSTATRCRGRCRAPTTRRGRRRPRRAPWPGSPSSGSSCSAPTSAPRPTTSSTSAAAASPRRSWSRGCATRFPEVVGRRRLRAPDRRHPRRPTSTS